MKSSRYGVWSQLQILRTRTGWTGVELANAAGISRTHYYDLERGRRWPNATMTKKLAKALRVPVTMLERPLSERERQAA